MIVVDTNVLVYFWLPTDLSESAFRLCDADPYWVAPPHWHSEFLNVLVRYIRAEKIDFEQAKVVLQKVEKSMQLKSLAVNPERVVQLSLDSGCSTYDCEFIALAERLSLPLVTHDKKVLKAFPDIAVPLIQFH